MTDLTRRVLLAAGAAALVAPPALAADEFTYRDWHFKLGKDTGAISPSLAKSFEAQIDIVEGLPIKPEIKAFWRGIPTEIDPTTPGGPGAYSFDRHRMILSTHPQPPENPVFLHELLHGYHDQKLGQRNPVLLAFYDEAKKSGSFPADSYMLSKPGEFFAMCGSVVLWGKAARPPATRANVKAKLPKLYDWIVGEFGLTGV